MEQNEHTPFIDDIPAYALGALDVDDVAALKDHLRQCASCRTKLAEYRAVSESLLTAVPPKQPSGMLRKRLEGQLPGARQKQGSPFHWNFSGIAMGLAVVAL